jgi:hypothetical protein
MTARAFPQDAFDVIDPAAIERGILYFMAAYQRQRTEMLAWFVVRYAQALCRHPDFEGTDEERCAWRRVASQWRLLARSLPTNSDGSPA